MLFVIATRLREVANRAEEAALRRALTLHTLQVDGLALQQGQTHASQIAAGALEDVSNGVNIGLLRSISDKVPNQFCCDEPCG